MEKYIEATTFTGSDFKVMTAFEGWKIGFLRYSDRFSDFKVIERHNETDEVFVLLEGTAKLYVEDESVEMEKSDFRQRSATA
jgi:mannose-6-phosphate isomerase-like protein (cupin superfamily)